MDTRARDAAFKNKMKLIGLPTVITCMNVNLIGKINLNA